LQKIHLGDVYAGAAMPDYVMDIYYQPQDQSQSVKCNEYGISATSDAEAISKAKLSFNYRIGDNSWLSGFVLRCPCSPTSHEREVYRYVKPQQV
jgi:hypothetical protein